jgi:hypothetical protein
LSPSRIGNRQVRQMGLAESGKDAEWNSVRRMMEGRQSASERGPGVVVGKHPPLYRGLPIADPGPVRVGKGETNEDKDEDAVDR